MTNTTRRRAERRRTTHRHWLAAAGVATALTGVITAAAISTGNDTPASAAIVRTGETNSMGMPVTETPGNATGTTANDGITATPQRWELGHVPLNVAVRPAWELRNASDHTITLGTPHVEINAGCCPGELNYTSPTLAPGQTTQLTFELSMHPGMDGPHDMTVHVPVQHENGIESTVELGVTGDFRN